ncbi:MAG: TIGR00266 family protein [Alphaproteobacteria bacterium]|nr:TIGR00266 family protein [Alphaproteobacteria bacterium]
MWFCLSGNQKYGPFSTEDAVKFIGKNPDCLVWREGMTDWAPASKFAVLNSNVSNSFPATTFRSDLSFKLYGDDLQYVEITLAPQESVIAEPGSMIFKDDPVILEAMLGGHGDKGFFGRMMGAGKRILSGERAFLSVFTNTSQSGAARVAFAAPYPGKIIPVSLSSLGGEIICQRDSFLCAESHIDIDIYFQKKILTGLFGGAGFIMQRLTGDGVVFINAGGAIAEIELDDDEILQTDVGCLAAFESSVDFDIEGAGSLKSQFFGGSGVFFASLKGPGKVWIQSLPFTRLVRKVASNIVIRQK